MFLLLIVEQHCVLTLEEACTVLNCGRYLSMTRYLPTPGILTPLINLNYSSSHKFCYYWVINYGKLILQFLNISASSGILVKSPP